MIQVTGKLQQTVKKRNTREGALTQIQRMSFVEKLILKGTPIHEILQITSDQYKVSSRQVYSYINKVNTRWIKHANVDHEKHYNEAVNRRQHLYFKAMEANDYHQALEVEKDLRKIQGLYIEKHAVLNKNIDADKMSNNELLTIISSSDN